MTLFNKVFNKHKSISSEGPSATSERIETLLSDPEADDGGSDAFLSALAANDSPLVSEVFDEAQAAEVPSAEDGQLALQREELAEAAAVAEATAAAAQSAPSPVQSISERAALAHREIEKSQFGPPAAIAPVTAPAAEVPAAPAPDPAASPRPGRVSRRVRTRMLGFDTGANTTPDVFAKAEPAGAAPAQTHPVGWIVVMSGPGIGHWFALFNGVSTIGRATDQTVPLDFGDTSISREKHAAVAYDDESNAFFLGHGGKSNIVRLNGRPVLSTEDLSHGDIIRIGETSLRFVALCGDEFSWGTPENADM